MLKLHIPKNNAIYHNNKIDLQKISNSIYDPSYVIDSITLFRMRRTEILSSLDVEALKNSFGKVNKKVKSYSQKELSYKVMMMGLSSNLSKNALISILLDLKENYESIN